MRSFSASHQLEDVFDAVFEWMTQPKAFEIARKRIEMIKADKSESKD